MSYNKISAEILGRIREIAGAANILLQPEDVEPYTHDETEALHYSPEAVVKPGDAEQISALLKLCNEHLIPVTPRGAGSG